MCSAVEVAWLAQNIQRVCDCIYSGLLVSLVNNNASSWMFIFNDIHKPVLGLIWLITET